MEFLRLASLILIGVLFALKLKQMNSPFWIYLSIGLSMFVLFYIVKRMGIILDYLSDVMDEVGIEDGYFLILIKIIGISYLCEFSSNICKESGFLAVAGQIEIGGKLTMMFMSMPILMAIIETITSVL
ncbi:MAG: SpoIIIAC/SpoIIIAD family protein [Lachnospiraceae bacterium]